MKAAQKQLIHLYSFYTYFLYAASYFYPLVYNNFDMHFLGFQPFQHFCHIKLSCKLSCKLIIEFCIFSPIFFPLVIFFPTFCLMIQPSKEDCLSTSINNYWQITCYFLALSTLVGGVGGFYKKKSTFRLKARETG